MTTILGLRSGGVSYLAADSRICASDPMPSKVNKIALRRSWAIGVSGPGAIVNLTHDAEGEPGERPADLIRWLRESLDAAGWKPEEKPGPREYGSWSGIAASAEGIYDISPDLSYCRIDDGEPWARGSGMEYARGACAAFLSWGGFTPERAIEEAICIAARFDPGTDDRVQIVRLGGEPNHESVVGHILRAGSFPGCPECGWVLGHALACSRRRVLACDTADLREISHGPGA